MAKGLEAKAGFMRGELKCDCKKKRTMCIRKYNIMSRMQERKKGLFKYSDFFFHRGVSRYCLQLAV